MYFIRDSRWMQNEFLLRQEQPNGYRYRQGRDLADKATRRQICRWGQNPESVGNAPHLSGVRGCSSAFVFGQDSLLIIDLCFIPKTIYSALHHSIF